MRTPEYRRALAGALTALLPACSAGSEEFVVDQVSPALLRAGERHPHTILGSGFRGLIRASLDDHTAAELALDWRVSIGDATLAAGDVEHLSRTELRFWTPTTLTAGVHLLRVQAPWGDTREVAVTAVPPATAPAPRTPQLVWASYHGHAIMAAGLDGAAPHALASELPGFPEGLLHDPRTGFLYWTEATPDRIARMPTAGGPIETVAALPCPDALVLEPGSGVFYGSSDCQETIWRSRFGGAPAEILLTDQGAVEEIVVDPAAGHLYWTRVDTKEIWRAALDGSGAQVVARDGDYVQGLAIDRAGGFLYWGNMAGDIVRARLDGSEATLLTAGLGTLDGLVLDPETDRIYWTAEWPPSLGHTRLDGQEPVTLLDNIPEPETILVLR
jgi:hypothetical protein